MMVIIEEESRTKRINLGETLAAIEQLNGILVCYKPGTLEWGRTFCTIVYGLERCVPLLRELEAYILPDCDILSIIYLSKIGDRLYDTWKFLSPHLQIDVSRFDALISCGIAVLELQEAKRAWPRFVQLANECDTLYKRINGEERAIDMIIEWYQSWEKHHGLETGLWIEQDVCIDCGTLHPTQQDYEKYYLGFLKQLRDSEDESNHWIYGECLPGERISLDTSYLVGQHVLYLDESYDKRKLGEEFVRIMETVYKINYLKEKSGELEHEAADSATAIAPSDASLEDETIVPSTAPTSEAAPSAGDVCSTREARELAIEIAQWQRKVLDAAAEKGLIVYDSERKGYDVGKGTFSYNDVVFDISKALVEYMVGRVFCGDYPKKITKKEYLWHRKEKGELEEEGGELNRRHYSRLFIYKGLGDTRNVRLDSSKPPQGHKFIDDLLNKHQPGRG